MARITEKYLEKNFCEWCRERDIQPIKGPSQFAKGFPDRFLQLPSGGGSVYVEFKGSSYYYGLTPMQQWWRKYLKDSSPNRYFLVEDEEQLEHLKQACLDFIKIGSKLVEYENYLLRNLQNVI